MTISNLILFLNRLPVTSDCARWMDELRAALLELFPDVDRIAININIYCDPVHPVAMCEDPVSVLFSNNGKKEGLAISQLPSPQSITTEFEAETGKNVPLEKYHAPKYFHYFHESGQYYGSMIFFRRIDKEGTSAAIYHAMAELEPFIKYIYASFLAMQTAAKPFNAAFRDVQNSMQNEARFSAAESKVVTLQICGYSYKQIAEHLSVSMNTVRSHIK
jgi:DNA-binding CsgD family transcriptional regulator